MIFGYLVDSHLKNAGTPIGQRRDELLARRPAEQALKEDKAGGFINECIEFEHQPIDKNEEPTEVWCKDSFWSKEWQRCLLCALKQGNLIGGKDYPKP